MFISLMYVVFIIIFGFILSVIVCESVVEIVVVVVVMVMIVRLCGEVVSVKGFVVRDEVYVCGNFVVL